MKKHLKLFFVIGLMCISSCGVAPKEETKDSIVSEENSTSQISSDISSSLSSSSNEITKPVNLPNADSELKKLAQSNGFTIDISCVYNSSYRQNHTLGCWGSYKWATTNDNEGYCFEQDIWESTNVTHVFTTPAYWQYAFTLVDASDLFNDTYGVIYDEIVVADKALKAEIDKAIPTKEIVIDREAYKYIVPLEGEDATVCIDRQYGICLEIVLSDYHYKVTRFFNRASMPPISYDVPSKYDVYADYASYRSGMEPINYSASFVVLNSFYIQFNEYKLVDGEKKDIITYNMIKKGYSIIYYSNREYGENTYNYFSEGPSSGYDIYKGSCRDGKMTWTPGRFYCSSERINDEIARLLYVNTFLQYIKSANAVPSKDKVIAGVSCKAYSVEIKNDQETTTLLFWADPNTKTIFYGQKTTTNLEDNSTTDTVLVDVTNYSTNVQSLYDYACESLLYRSGDGSPLPTDTHHVYGPEQVIQAGNCVQAGTKGQKCIYCGDNKITGEVPIDPDNHISIDSWYKDDGEGHHYKECSYCYKILEIGDHVYDESKKRATCSGKNELYCMICGMGSKFFDVDKCEEHTYNYRNFVIDENSYVNSANDMDVLIRWHCDCWNDNSAEAGADLTWNLPKFGNSEYWELNYNYGYYSVYQANAEAQFNSLKTIWPSATDDVLRYILRQIITAMVREYLIYSGSWPSVYA